MDRDIRWSPRAASNFEDICEFIAEDSEYYAQKLADEIYQRIEELPKFPESGRIVPEFNNTSLRERIYQNYRIVYRVESEVIEIVTIHHSAKPLDDLG